MGKIYVWKANARSFKALCFMKNEAASNVEVVRKRKMAIKIVEKREKWGNFWSFGL